MARRTTKISKEWGEIGFGSRKRDGYYWEVVLYHADGEVYDRRFCASQERANQVADDWIKYRIYERKGES